MTATHVALLLLCVVAPLGAFDVLYFHIWKFRLHARRSSHAETATHIVRSVLIGSLALTLARYEPRGAWFFVVAALLVLDFANNLLDVWLEDASRADLGGVPRPEYLIHIVGSTAGGAVTASFIILGRHLAALPTGLHASALPGWLVWNARSVAVGAFAMAILESCLVVRAMMRDQELALEEA